MNPRKRWGFIWTSLDGEERVEMFESEDARDEAFFDLSRYSTVEEAISAHRIEPSLQ